LPQDLSATGATGANEVSVKYLADSTDSTEHAA